MIVNITCMKCGQSVRAKSGTTRTLTCQSCGCTDVKFSSDAVVHCVNCKEPYIHMKNNIFRSVCKKCHKGLWTITSLVEYQDVAMEIEENISPEDVVLSNAVSAVVVCHNLEGMTVDCIDKLRKVPEIKEIILVDNGSIEPIGKWAKKQKDIVYIRNETNLGPAVARNQGVKKAFNDWLFFIDNDQMVSKNVISRMAKENKDIVGIEAWQLDAKGTPSPSTSTIEFNTYVGTGGMLIKSRVFKAIEGFDEQYALWYEDTDLCLRARQRGYEIGCIANHNVQHLEHRTMNTQKTFNSSKEKQVSRKLFVKRWGTYLKAGN